jgi:orotate phosphoribosyltransferase
MIDDRLAADINEAGGQVIAIVCAIWRGEGSPAIKALPALPVLPALTRDELSDATN